MSLNSSEKQIYTHPFKDKCQYETTAIVTIFRCSFSVYQFSRPARGTKQTFVMVIQRIVTGNREYSVLNRNC